MAAGSPETSHRLRLLDVLERITRVSLSSESMDQVLSGVLDLVLEEFAADRAWFLFPCDPKAPSYGVPMLRNRPSWPLAAPEFRELPMTGEAVRQFERLLAVPHPIQYGPQAEDPVPHPGTEMFSIRTQMVVALRPKIGSAWAFGLHHCADEVMHDEEGLRLFSAIAARISDTLDGLILTRQMRESESKYRMLFDHANDGIFIHSESSILDCNLRAARMYGWTKEELLSRPQSDLYPERQPNGRLSRELAGEKTAAAMRGEFVPPFEWMALRSDGVPFDAEVRISSVMINGRARVQAVVRDITEHKQAEAALRVAAAAFDSQEGLMVTDANGVIVRVNRAFTETTGYSAEEAIGQTPRLLRSGRHSPEFYRDMWQAITSEGVWQGEIWDRRKNGEEYPKWLTISAVKNAEGLVTHYVGAQFDITERKRAERKINELAFFDQLTGLPNRTLLLDRMRQAMTASSRSGAYGALLLLDLDKFKGLNDTLGHDMGDLLLQQVAQRLTSCVRDGDTVARLGGDEFVVMLADLSPVEVEAAAQTEAVGEKILAALDQAYLLEAVTHRSTSSIGATLFRGHLAPIEDLLKQADLAMYKAKEAGRNALRFFDPEMEVVVLRRVALEADLRNAIQGQEFLLHYQAQVAGGQLTGAEALVRWQHPQRGLVSPAEFISLAEETEMILPLGRWVLETACRELALWARRPGMDHLTLAVNVSARQFRQPDFVDQVLAALASSGANPKRLKLELTESLLVSNVQEIIEKMFSLKAKGVGFSLDDFGTGYSSLTYLKRLPLDQLKIDQSFVRDILIDPNDAAIARTVIALAQSLGLGVIAEGVETEAQRDFLASAGCHAYQGYFLSRPLPIDGFKELVQGGFKVQLGGWPEVAAAARSVRMRVFVEEQGVPPELECDALDASSRHALAVDAEGRAIGTGRLLPDGHVGRMAVLPEWRSRGVGAAMLGALMASARASGMRQLALNAQAHAVGFYGRFGFVPAGSEFMEAGIVHVPMARDLG